MTINNLKIYNFRCFSNLFVRFHKGINIIFGPNAVGKTSVLEAVSFVGLTKSFKTSNESEMIKDDCSEMAVIVEVDNSKNKMNVYKIQKTTKGKVVIKNNFKYSKISDFIGELLLVSFCNNDLTNLLGTPKERRKIFEPIFCQISHDYLDVCNYYQRILNERNALLKRLMFEKNNKLLELLQTLDEQLVVNGIKIIEVRTNFIERINEKAKQYHRAISNQKEELELVYKPSIRKEDFLTVLRENVEQDIKKGLTSVGPHRDDYLFFINNKNVILFGSQGQQRSSLISTKLAFVEELKEVKEDYPVLLLDDIFSELDKERQNDLLKLIDSNIQTFISTATLADIDKSILDKANIITLIEEE